MHIVTEKTKREHSVHFGFKELMQEQDNTECLTLNGMSYSHFMGKIHANGIELNRKVLADLAMNNPEAFKAIVDKVK